MTRTAAKRLPGFLPGINHTLLLAIFMGGCAGTNRVPLRREITLLPVLTVDQAIAGVHERDAAVRTMRARFNAAVQSAADERRASGVVVVKKPDRLRLRLLSPFGLTVMDYILAGTVARLQLPLEGKVLIGDEIEHDTSFSPTAFAPAFLSKHNPLASTCTVEMAESYADCWEQETSNRRTVRIDLRQGVVQRETFYAADDETLRLEYTDYRVVDGMLMPFRIDATARGEGLRLRIDIVAYELNPELADSLFEPSAGAR